MQTLKWKREEILLIMISKSRKAYKNEIIVVENN